MKEEKSKMLLNNRPMVENLNRQNDALRNNSEKGINAYTVVLCVLCVAVAVVFFVFKSIGFGLFFLGLAVLLAVVAYFSYRAERRDREARLRARENQHPEAIFKDHEE